MTAKDQKKYQNELLAFKVYSDSDDIKVKEKIKEMLASNYLIMYALNNKELLDKDCNPSDYFGKVILPYYLVEDIQSSAKNFICYEVSYDMAQSYQYSKSHNALNSTVKTLSIIFHILCDEKDLIDKKIGNTPRHDLLAALIQDQFNWSNEFGSKLMLVSDVPSTVDKHYACRTMVFQQTTDNNIVKTIDDIPRFINKINNFREYTYNGEEDN